MARSYSAYALWVLSVASLSQAHPSVGGASIDHLFTRDLSASADTSAVPRPALGSVPYGTTITTCSTPGTVALTFDDGPGPYTSSLLDLLAANGIRATFFILGNQIEQKYVSVVQRMYAEGHQVASHTWDHKSLDSLSSSGRAAEMYQNEAAFTTLLGVIPTYMRPPYGFCAGACLNDMGRLGYHVINWNVDTKDYQNDSPSKIQVSKNNWDAAFRGSSQTASFIPLTHDVHYNTVATLTPYMIQSIIQRGFAFATVGECLGDPKSNWYRDPSSGYASASTKLVRRAASPNDGALASVNVMMLAMLAMLSTMMMMV